MPFLRQKRSAGIEAHVWIAGNERIFAEPLVFQRIVNHHDARLQNRVSAESNVARRFLVLNSNFRFEPLPALVNEAHERDRRAADQRGQA